MPLSIPEEGLLDVVGNVAPKAKQQTQMLREVRRCVPSLKQSFILLYVQEVVTLQKKKF